VIILTHLRMGKNHCMKMEIEKMAMGEYSTNCYILHFDNFELLIDTGVDALAWIENRVSNPVAILLTHGHFDHVWDMYKVAKKYNIKVFINSRDKVFLENDPFEKMVELYQPQYITLLEDNASLNFNGVDVIFHHFPGHSEGSSLIEIGKHYFSGDFIFRDSIGRFDFPYSDGRKMKNSLEKAISTLNETFLIYPGHGGATTLKMEKNNLRMWMNI